MVRNPPSLVRQTLDLVQPRGGGGGGGGGVKVLRAAELSEEIRTTWQRCFLERRFSHITETLRAHLLFG